MGCRSTRARGRALITVAAALLGGTIVTPAAGAAEVWPPGEPADGVRVVGSGDGTAIVFERRADRLYRTIAGKRIVISCVRHDASGSGSSGGMEWRAPKLRRPLRIGRLARGADYCRVWLPKRTAKVSGERQTIGPRPVIAIPLTQRGTLRLDEEAKAMALELVLTAAESLAGDARRLRFAAPERVIRFLGRAGRAAPFEVVRLADATATPRAGTVGYYSDGREHAAVVTESAAGRRLFVEFLPGDEIRTNVLQYLNSDPSDEIG